MSGKPEESRFAKILEPIKDLALSWNIDIAHELAHYLEELETLTFSSRAENLDYHRGSVAYSRKRLCLQRR